jgi:RNA polymerase-binding transcription factor
METSHIKKVRILLESRYNLLFKRVHNRNAIAIENTADTMDEVRLAEERDLATRLLERDFADIRLVDAALSRIKNGTYGLCLRCDETISLNRLDVMPHAAYCVKCQEAVERDGENIDEVSFHEGVTGALVGQ